MGTPASKPELFCRPLTLIGHTELALAALATLQSHSHKGSVFSEPTPFFAAASHGSLRLEYTLSLTE